MKKIKLCLLALAVLGLFSMKANAQGVGFINYQKVQENYSFAIQAVKEVQSETITLTERVFHEARVFEVSDEEKQQHIEFVKGIKNNLWGIVPDESK